MKNFLLMLALLPTILFAQPTKNKVDSVTLVNGSIFYWINGTKYLGGSIVDSRANFIIPNRNNVSTGYRNNLFGFNGSAGGTANTIIGNNGVIDAGAIGVFMPGTDCHAYPNASYSDVGGDGNDAFEESTFTRGFGNDNHSPYGAMFGNDNFLDKFPSSFMFAQRSSGRGARSFTVGRAVASEGDDIYTFGTGRDNTLDSLRSKIPSSFNIGFNQQMIFQVVRGGYVIINGIWYKFPVEQGAPGSVLTNDGNGNLYWSGGATLTQKNKFGSVTAKK